MTRIALETSARPPSLAVEVGGRRGLRMLEVGRRHASDLLRSLGELLAELGGAAGGIEVVVVGTGPGSYTGLRVGIATALGLVRGTGAALGAVPSVEALAFGELREGEQGVVVLDARAGGVYVARYRRLAHEIETVLSPCLVRAGEVGEMLGGNCRILGDATVADVARLDEGQRARLSVGAVPRADAVLQLGLGRMERDGPVAPEKVEPLYLRPYEARVRRR